MSGNHDWISLVDVSGLVVSEPVLHERFPDGPPSIERGLSYRFRKRYERWQVTKRESRRRNANPEHFTRGRRQWINFVLEDLLDYGDHHDYALRRGTGLPLTTRVELVDYQQTLEPDQVLVGEKETPVILVYVADGDLDRPEQKTGKWKASPFTKLDRLLRETGTPLGILTNGDEWRLVYSPEKLPTAYITWTALGWHDESFTLNAFRMLLADPAQLLEMATESQDRQTDVADQLGEQVRAGLWILVHAMDDADRAANGDLLRHMSLDDIYEMGIFVMMRVLFLLYAEEHRLLPHGEALYDNGYGLTYLWTRLQRQHSEDRESLHVTHDAWLQLLATFRLVHMGVDHPDLNMLAYGGSLFDPDRYPVLEAPGMLINNYTMYRILHRILLAEGKIGRETVMQRVSYRSLDVEQFGYMYEGLLDHVVKRAAEPTLALQGTKNKQPELPLRELEELDGDDLIDYLKSETGRSTSALTNSLEREIDDEDTLDAIMAACDGDEDLFQRVMPYADLLFEPDNGMAVIPEGRLYVTTGATRRATGTHYTPVTLTAPIVENTLKPLVYRGIAEGLPEEEWVLKSPTDLLDLKVCDMAMGSGAFLVQACRYLSARLLDAWQRAESHTRGRITIEGDKAKPGTPETHIVPDDQQDRDILARRLIADRCLYGVDKNPLAVEMAKLSLWLITLDKHRPFTFLDHALKAGDSLVGVTIEQLNRWDLETTGSLTYFTDDLRDALQEVVEIRQTIAATPVNTIQDQNNKAHQLDKAKRHLEHLKGAADLLIASYFNDLNKTEQNRLRQELVDYVQRGYSRMKDMPSDMDEHLPLHRITPFHWELEFPEVFLDERGGFDAFIGNPPFMGGKKISTEYGPAYREHIAKDVGMGRKGSADICAYFFLRGFDFLRSGGNLGLIATNTIAQGGTHDVGLAGISAQNGTIYQAMNNARWPGTAAVVVNIVNIHKGIYQGEKRLDGVPAKKISSMLDTLPATKPWKLFVNADKSFQGTIVLGAGFILETDEAMSLTEKDARNRDVLFPYLNGQDLNSRPDQSPSRWIINFRDWDYEKASQFEDCMRILIDRVKPQRDNIVAKGGQIHEYDFWKYWDRRDFLYRTIEPLERVLAIALTSRTCAFAFTPSNIVFSHAVGVFAFETSAVLALLQSTFHVEWAWKYGSSMKGDLRYTPSDIFETFPFPPNLVLLEEIGEQYHHHRKHITITQEQGLTDTYNRFHNPDETAEDIDKLRRLHVEMDTAVASAYGWDDLDLGHGFRETPQGLRYTISEPARREVLLRLLDLNQERYVDEVRQGLHGNKAKSALEKAGKSGKGAQGDSGQMRMF